MQRTTIARSLKASPLSPVLAFLALTALEVVRPLRRSVQDKVTRLGRNLTVSAAAAVAIQICEMPVALALARAVERHGWGLVHLLPSGLRVAAAVLAMDYTLYVWHVLAHKSPFLWRIHRVHHADLDLDASTALRFHFVEHIVSVPWRAAQILVIGVTPAAFALWQGLLMLSVLFHHSNVRLPRGLERALEKLIVTPRLHGIHHATVTRWRESNWSSGLTLWDHLHGTYLSGIEQERITIGLADYRDPRDVRLARLWRMPLDPPTP